MDNKIRLEIVGITYNQIESGVYALILRQADGTRRIPIIIGAPEAQAIECKLQEVMTPRPLTHDMMANTLTAFGIRLEEVMIRKLPSGVFAADLVLTDGQKQRRVDSRSSDAVALAIRVGAPIYTTAEVIDESGFDVDENGSVSTAQQTREQKKPLELNQMTNSQLEQEMASAIEAENYERAAEIKAELDRRK